MLNVSAAIKTNKHQLGSAKTGSSDSVHASIGWRIFLDYMQKLSWYPALTFVSHSEMNSENNDNYIWSVYTYMYLSFFHHISVFKPFCSILVSPVPITSKHLLLQSNSKSPFVFSRNEPVRFPGERAFLKRPQSIPSKSPLSLQNLIILILTDISMQTKNFTYL